MYNELPKKLSGWMMMTISEISIKDALNADQAEAIAKAEAEVIIISITVECMMCIMYHV